MTGVYANATEPQHCHNAHIHNEERSRIQNRTHSAHGNGTLGEYIAVIPVGFDFLVLSGERPNNTDTVQIFTGMSCNVVQFALILTVAGNRPAGHAVQQHADDRNGDQKNDGQLQVDPHCHNCRTDNQERAAGR